MTATGQFVCAFRGRRDDYQVPLALAEVGMLDRLVTDFYAISPLKKSSAFLPLAVRERIEFRCKAGIPDRKVKQLPWLAGREFMLRKNFPSVAELRDSHDYVLSMAAAATARSHRADLLLYSAYAIPAFNLAYDHDAAKIVFQYHPHYATEHALLVEDDMRRRARGLGALETENTVVRPRRMLSDDAWRQSDHIICASSFTARTLVEAGARPDKISVIGYGTTLATQNVPLVTARDGPFRVLFVGSGVQRKGIHHLLSAWRRANLPVGAELLVVTRSLDRSLVDLKGLPSNVKVLPGLPHRDLISAYRNASLFCMPSLIEGFGQVYLEALGEGLPVLGTANTCLPDLGGENDGIFLSKPGDIDDLTTQLERLSKVIPGNTPLKEAARGVAMRCDWGNFRRKLQTVCRDVAAKKRSGGHESGFDSLVG